MNNITCSCQLKDGMKIKNSLTGETMIVKSEHNNSNIMEIMKKIHNKEQWEIIAKNT